MKKNFLLIAFLFLAGSLSLNASTLDDWSGDVTAATTWSGTVNVTSDVNISAVLTIDPGTQVIFQGQYSLSVSSMGSIIANGMPESTILFTAQDQTAGWRGIDDMGGTSGSSFTYCRFEYAKNVVDGAALRTNNSNTVVSYCKFMYNEAQTANGGALSVVSGSPKIFSNVFDSNTSINGGAIYTNDSDVNIYNNIFVHNSATNGGAVYISGSAPLIAHNTFYDNTASTAGHELYLSQFSAPVYNCIFKNTVNTSDLIEIDGAEPTFEHIVITNGEAAIVGSHLTSEIYNFDPELIDPENYDFGITPISSCIDEGYDMGSVYPSAPEYDYDHAGNTRMIGEGYDIGAYEVQEPVVADAGEDQVLCNSTAYMNANMTASRTNVGHWTINNGSGGEILSPEDPYTQIINIPPGDNFYTWTVSDMNGIYSASDVVMVTNTSPVIDAGEDISLMLTSTGESFPDVNLNANDPASDYGEWTVLDPAIVIVDNTTYSKSLVTNIQYGIHNLVWTITRFDDSSCSASDTLAIIAGYSNVADLGGNTGDWSDPSSWSTGQVPGPADSVTIYNGAVTMGAGTANADRIVIGNGGGLELLGTSDRATSSVNAHSLYIEQSAERFPGVRGTAVVRVHEYSTLNIGAEYARNSRSVENSGINIGGGGSLFIEQTTSATTDATVNLASGTELSIEGDAALAAPAQLRIGGGGVLNVAPTTTRDMRATSGNSNVRVGTYGSLYIEQIAERAPVTTGVGEMRMGGGSLYIEQSAERATAPGGQVYITGGSLYIEQSAERAPISRAKSGIYVSNGGSLYIEQIAERNDASVTTPELTISGGKVRVGSVSRANRGLANLNYGSLYIEQSAERAAATDTALIIDDGGTLAYTSESGTYDGWGEIKIEENQAMQVMSTGAIDFGTGGGQITLGQGASFIDLSGNPVSAEITHLFTQGQTQSMSFPISGLNTGDLWSVFEAGAWSETAGGFDLLGSGAAFNAGVGYNITFLNETVLNPFTGNLNTGTISVPLTADVTGWNFIGNPYPSFIDWEAVSIPADMSPVYYIFDEVKQNYQVYQQGGITLNGASSFIPREAAFFVKAEAAATLNFEDACRTHYFSSTARNTDNSMKLSVTDGGDYSDETSIHVDPSATENYESDYDAVKKFSENTDVPAIYTHSIAEDYELAINGTSDPTTSTVIPVTFKSAVSGTYTVTATDVANLSSLEVYMVDLTDLSEYDILATPSFSFTHDAGASQERDFEIRFRSPADVEALNLDYKLYVNDDNTLIIRNNSDENLTVSVFDISGKLLTQNIVQKSETNNMNLNFASGIYLVKLESNGLSQTQKIILK